MKAGDMKGKVVLVTGAASGLGRATAITAAKHGASVCIVDINAAGLEETAALVKQHGVDVLVHTTNLTQHENCVATIGAAVKKFGRLDALCNVAGVLIACHAHEMSAADFEKTLAVNFNAPFFLIQTAIPHLLEANGAVVNITSSGAFIGEAYAVAYTAAKAALHHLTKSLAMEYMHKPIRFNSVAPGGMITPMGMTMKLPEDCDKSLLMRYRPLRGVIEIDDVADLIVFLASDAARAYHGASIAIDKGITAG